MSQIPQDEPKKEDPSADQPGGSPDPSSNPGPPSNPPRDEEAVERGQDQLDTIIAG